MVDTARPSHAHHWPFVVRWTLACALSWTVGLPIFALSVFPDSLILRMASAGVAGVIVGVSQWTVLRGRIAHGALWIIGTAAPTALAGSAGVGMIVAMFYLPPVGFLFGAIVGLTQWLALRAEFSRSGWWIVWSTLGVGIGWLAAVGAVTRMGLIDTSAAILFGFFAGAVTGLITGLPLARLLQRRRAPRA